MLRVFTSSLIIAALATILWFQFGEKNFEVAATRTALAYEMRGTCPLSQDFVQAADVGLVSICSTFGIKAYLAARDNPEVAGTLFATYGEVPEFREVVDQHGSEALAIIQYFRERDSIEFRTRARVKQLWEQFSHGNSLDVPPVKLTPDEHGYIAIQEIKRRGHTMLAEFEFTNGVHRKQVKRFLNATTDFFTGGITDLEAAMLRGEKVTWNQVAFAALDVVVVIGGASVIVKALKAPRAVQKGAVLAKMGSTFSTFRSVVRSVAAIGAVSTTAIVLYNPSLMISAAGWVGEIITGHAWVGVAILAMIVASGIMTIFEFVYRIVDRFLIRPLRHTYRFGRWAERKLAQRRERRAHLRSQHNAQSR